MKQRQLGIILLVIGLGLLFWGYSESGSLSGRLSSALSGSPGDRAMIMYITGGVFTVLGLFKLFK